jgi:ribosomal protein L40E
MSDQASKKLCKKCRTEIDSQATKCPHCRSEQRDFLRKHPIISGAIIIFGLFFVFAIISNNTEKSNTPIQKASISEESVQSLKKDLDGWAQGRWTDVVVGQTDGELIARVYAQPEANEVALNGYCKILKDSATKYIPSGFKLNLFVYQFGKVAKACM